MAQLDISLIIYSDKNQENQVALIPLFTGSKVNHDLWKCWHWAEDNGFTVYNPAIYDPRFKDKFKNAGTIISKEQITEWINEDILSSEVRNKVDGEALLKSYPDNYVFKLIFVDWS